MPSFRIQLPLTSWQPQLTFKTSLTIGFQTITLYEFRMIHLLQQTNLNPSWQTISNLLCGEYLLLTDWINSGFGLVKGNPKNKPAKLLCTVLFIIVPAQYDSSVKIRSQIAPICVMEKLYYQSHCRCFR